MIEKTTSTKFLLVGKITSTYGIKGWNKVISYTEPVTNIFKYHPWQLQIQGKAQKVSWLNHKVQHKNLLVQIEHCFDRETAQSFCGAAIYADRQLLPKLNPGSYYWTDLQQLRVYNRQGALLGIVDHLIPTGSNDVLVVEGKKRYLIPFLLGQSIDEIDLEKGIIQVDWDEDF